MAMPKHSARLQALWDELSETHSSLSDDVYDLVDSSCTSGYDNDGSTGREIFENGYQLAEKAAGKPVFYVNDVQQVLFFIGTEDEIEASLKTVGS